MFQKVCLLSRMAALLLLSCAACATDAEKYTVNPDGTVSDNETGLTWQQQTSHNLLTQAQAIDYCRSLRLVNMSWSLPTLDELLTIRAGFPDQPRVTLWTSDQPHQSFSDAGPVLVAWAFGPSEDGGGGPTTVKPNELLEARCVNHNL